MRKVNTPSKKNTGARPPFHLGSRLRALRSARKLTLDGLSRMAGVSKAMLSQIEQDKVNPTVAVVFKIARALQVGMGDLLAAPEQQNVLRVIPAGEEAYTYRSDQSCTIRTLSPLSEHRTAQATGIAGATHRPRRPQQSATRRTTGISAAASATAKGQMRKSGR